MCWANVILLYVFNTTLLHTVPWSRRQGRSREGGLERGVGGIDYGDAVSAVQSLSVPSIYSCPAIPPPLFLITTYSHWPAHCFCVL